MKRTPSLFVLPVVLAGILAASGVAEAAIAGPVRPAVDDPAPECDFAGLWVSDTFGETKLEQTDPGAVTGTYYDGDGRIQGKVEEGTSMLVARGTWIQGPKSSDGLEDGKQGELRFYLNAADGCDEINGHWRERIKDPNAPSKSESEHWGKWQTDWDMRRV